MNDTFLSLEHDIVSCRTCDRLVKWREKVATEKKACFRDQTYWGKPVPGFGDRQARLLILGLAPAAHGGNRTGRVFTGDKSGDWLYRALHRAGFANQPTSVNRWDGLVLHDCYILAVVRCAPPDNKPLPAETLACQPYLDRELRLLPAVQMVVTLGRFAYDNYFEALKRAGKPLPRHRPAFSHGGRVIVEEGPTVLASYHPSQRNTSTKLLTEPMFDEIFSTARTHLKPISR
ncbi:MAG: uracil-DNA glycosylase [Blastocatellia bacterium]|nr:uracil-DNA glycosylase [Blastocatellia bacterium]